MRLCFGTHLWSPRKQVGLLVGGAWRGEEEEERRNQCCAEKSRSGGRRVPRAEPGWGALEQQHKVFWAADGRGNIPPPPSTKFLRKLLTWNLVLRPLASVLFAFQTGSVQNTKELCINCKLRGAYWPQWVLDLYQAKAEGRAKFYSLSTKEWITSTLLFHLLFLLLSLLNRT